MAKKKAPEMYEGKPVLVAANKEKLVEAVEKFKTDYPDIPLEAPYVVRVKGKKVKAHGFENCAEIGVVILHDNVEIVAVYAFNGCSSLTSIMVPASVTEIDSRAFQKCTLTNMKVAEDNPKFDSRDNCNAIIETATNKLYSGCSTTVIPNSVTEIANEAFWYCSGLTSIEIPDSVTKIGRSAFTGCTDLTSITIPASVKEIDDSAFESCRSLTSISIPDSVTEIKCNTFYGCSNLTSVSIPNSITTIDRAFGGCSSLISIVIPASVEKIYRPFHNCSGLTSIVVVEGNKTFDSRENCNAIIETATGTLVAGCQTTVIPNSVTKIGSGAFSECTGLTSIVIPDSVTEVKVGAFIWCKNLKEITISDAELLNRERTNLRDDVKIICQRGVLPEPEIDDDKPMSLIEKLTTDFIIETEDQVYYDAETADEKEKKLFIANIQAQNVKEEQERLASMLYVDADDFIKVLSDEDDDLNLAQKLVAAAYCTRRGIKIDDDTEVIRDFDLYYFNTCCDNLHYEYEIDIDLG